MGAFQSSKQSFPSNEYFKYENDSLDNLLTEASKIGCSIIIEESYNLKKIEIIYKQGNRHIQTSFLLNKDTNYDKIYKLVQDYIEYIKSNIL
jgi:hypothetical protein